MSTTLPALYAVVRGVIYLALLLLVGTETARRLVGRTFAGDAGLAEPIARRLSRLTVVVMAILPLLVLARGAMQVRSLLDPGDQVTTDVVRAVLIESPWGHAWYLQLIASLVLAIVLGLRHRRPSIGVLPVATCIAVVLWAQTGMGHAATDRWPAHLGRILDGGHVFGAGLWLGTLASLGVAAVPLLHGEDRLAPLARLIGGFSIYARIGVVLVILSGTAAALVYAGSLTLFVGSTWGKLLLAKLAGMLGVMVLGWYNWRVVTPALDGLHPTARVRLRRAIQFELVLVLVMLAITTLLVVSPLPGEG